MTGDIHIEERELGDDLWLVDASESEDRQRWLCSDIYVDAEECV